MTEESLESIERQVRAGLELPAGGRQVRSEEGYSALLSVSIRLGRGQHHTVTTVTTLTTGNIFSGAVHYDGRGLFEFPDHSHPLSECPGLELPSEYHIVK